MKQKTLQKDYQEFLQEQQIKNAPPKTFKRVYTKIGRNNACPCNSGKKYKNCCINRKK